MTRREVAAFIEALALANPQPESELTFVDPYTLLVAVVLSAQATDASVNKATASLFREAPDPAAMLRLGEDGVARHIRTIGLWRAKARNVVALSQQLLAEHGGTVPSARAALEALPGVGRKTASVVLNVAFGEDAMAVDTHIFRIGNRTGMAPGRTPRAVEDGLVRRIPPERLRASHHWLILHGRYVCKARAPECWRCAGRDWCRYPDKRPAPPGATISATPPGATIPATPPDATAPIAPPGATVRTPPPGAPVPTTPGTPARMPPPGAPVPTTTPGATVRTTTPGKAVPTMTTGKVVRTTTTDEAIPTAPAAGSGAAGGRAVPAPRAARRGRPARSTP